MEPSRTTLDRPVSRRTIVRGGFRLAYAAPLITATYGLAPLRAGAVDDVLSSDQALRAAEQGTAENQPPVAAPGEGFEVTDSDGDGFETVTVDGSASADPDGRIASYRWTFRDEVVGSDAVATVTLPVGTHRLELTVTDDKGATDARRMRIRVYPGEQPQEQEPVQDETQAEEQQTDAAPAEPALPPAPYGLEAKQKFAEVALTWTADAGTPVPIRVYRTVDDGLNRPLDELEWVLLWEEWSQPSYRDAAVEVGVPYLYVVRSFDGVNESERSNVAAITLTPVEQPVEEAPVEQAPVEEPVVDEAPVEQPTEEPAVEEATVDEAPTEEPVADQGS
jgi:hypothetical protein